MIAHCSSRSVHRVRMLTSGVTRAAGVTEVAPLARGKMPTLSAIGHVAQTLFLVPKKASSLRVLGQLLEGRETRAAATPS